MSTTRVRRSSQNIFRTKKPIVNKIPKIICIGISVSMAFCGLLFGQQAQKEYIYLDGRIVAVESRSYSPPTFAITSPTSDSSYDTGSSSITLAGTASPEVTSVIWTNSNGGNGNCTGTTSWSCSITGLQNGTNVLTVTGRNGDYGFVADSLTVYYCTYSIAPASAGKTAGAGSGERKRGADFLKRRLQMDGRSQRRLDQVRAWRERHGGWHRKRCGELYG